MAWGSLVSHSAEISLHRKDFGATNQAINEGGSNNRVAESLPAVGKRLVARHDNVAPLKGEETKGKERIAASVSKGSWPTRSITIEGMRSCRGSQVSGWFSGLPVATRTTPTRRDNPTQEPEEWQRRDRGDRYRMPPTARIQ